VVLVGAIHTEKQWTYHLPNLIGLARKAYATVVHSEHERQWLIGRDVSPERVRVIGHGVDVGKIRREPGRLRAECGIPPDAFVVAYIGAHAPRKGIDTLIAVFPHVLEREANAWLVIAGAQTPHTTALERLVAGLPEAARTRVRLMSDVSEQRKHDILSDCDVLASPSSEEAFGITVLEAWAHEKPVVVGDSPGQRSVVEHGRLGLVVRYGDAHQLRDALLALADDAVLRHQLGRAGREELAARYELSGVVARYHALFCEAVESARRMGAD